MPTEKIPVIQRIKVNFFFKLPYFCTVSTDLESVNSILCLQISFNSPTKENQGFLLLLTGSYEEYRHYHAIK